MMRIRSFWFFVFQKRIRPQPDSRTGVGAEDWKSEERKKAKKKKSPPSNASK